MAILQSITKEGSVYIKGDLILKHVLIEIVLISNSLTTR